MTNIQFAKKVANRMYNEFNLYEVSYSLGDMFGDYPEFHSPNKEKYIDAIVKIILEEINEYKKQK